MMNQFKRECDAALQGVTFDSKQQQAVYARIAGYRKPHRIKRRVATAFLVAALMLTGAFAVQVIRDNIRQTMSDWEDTHAGTTLGLSQSDAGYTVTLNEIYGDTWYVYVKGTVCREDGEPWKVDSTIDHTGSQYAEITFCEHQYEIPQQDTQDAYGFRMYFLNDTDSKDAKQEFIIRMDAVDFALTGKATVEFDGLWYKTDGVEQIVEGNWGFEFPVTRQDDGEILEVGKTIQTNKGTITLERLQFSALDVTAEWSGPNQTIFCDDPENTYVLLKSGQRLRVTTTGISDASGEVTRMEYVPFNGGLGHVSADDVQAVVFDGQEIAIE